MSSNNNLPAIKKLIGRENYCTWQFAVKTYLEHEELEKCILGTETDAKKISKAKTKIILLLDEVNYVHIQGCETAKEVWDKLAETFDDSGLSRRVSLLRTLITTKLEDCDSIEDFVNRIISTAHKLNAIKFTVPDEWIGTLLLAGLPENYGPMIMGIENSGTKITGDVTHTFSQELHRKLRPLCPDIRNIELPSTAFKIFFIKSDKSSLEKAKGQIQKYLNFVLEEEFLNQSEAIYTLLSPSSENLKQSTPSPKKPKFSLSTLFKTTTESTKSDPFWGPCGQREGEEDISLFLQGVASENENIKTSEIDLKDSIAEPLYALMDEVFDMGGVFKWFRRKLISLVQITYGRTINRQIRESINYLFDEPMLHYYTSTLLKSFWPGGTLAYIGTYPVRTEDMQEQTVQAARSLLTNNIPEVMCNLVGAETAKHGATKVFEAVQNANYNKQLFYELLEIVMVELFPEIRQLKTATKPMTNNVK